MNKLKFLFVLSLLLAVSSANAQSMQTQAEANVFTLTSTSFANGANIPQQSAFDLMGCGGQNLSPQLKWVNAPAETKSFVVTIYDPDAPTISGFWHWGVYNIPANISEFVAGVNKSGGLPPTAQQMFTDYGSTGYGGPCPPVGDIPHKYVFTVYALDIDKLDINPATSTGAFLMFNIRNNILAKAQLTGLYQR